MTNPTIFLDVDGVLADFVGAAARRLGKDPKHIRTWDMHTPWGLEERAMWEAVDTPDLWLDLDLYAGANLFYHTLKHYGDVVLCTKPSRNPDGAGAKRQWAQKYFGAKTPMLIVYGSKAPIAGPGKILVDDADRNIEEWTEAGGLGVLFPRPWNAAQDISDSFAHPADVYDFVEYLVATAATQGIVPLAHSAEDAVEWIA